MQATPTSTAPTSQNNNTAKLVEDVKVAGRIDSLRVEIPEPTNLGRVFRAICDQQKLDCTGANTLSRYSVPKMKVDGTLREVIGNLLEELTLTTALPRHARNPFRQDNAGSSQACAQRLDGTTASVGATHLLECPSIPCVSRELFR